MIEGAVAVRRRTMQAVRSYDTEPERAVRRLVCQLGYRYRLHAKALQARFYHYRKRNLLPPVDVPNSCHSNPR